MFTPSELERLPKQIERYMRDMEEKILIDVVHRIKVNNEITSTGDNLLYRLKQYGQYEQDIKSYIQSTLKLTDAEIDNIFNNAIEVGYTRDKSLYEATGKQFIEYKNNAELQQLVSAIKQQTKNEIRNITQTTGFMVNMNGKKVYTPASQYLHDKLDKAAYEVLTGSFSYDKSIKDTVKELADGGIRSIDYSNGRSINTVTAVRMCVVTGVNQVVGHITQSNAEKLETEHFEISWHATARPSHQVWQGRVKSKQQLIDECGLGTAGGLLGVNCYHSYYPFVPGVSKRTYTDEQLEQMQADENTKIKFGDKEYTKYEATQRMRKMEAQMRTQRKNIKLLKEGGASQEDLVNAKVAYQATSQQYSKFAEKMELPMERQRVYADGLGRVM